MITEVGFAFVDREGLTPVQGWNSCLEQRPGYNLGSATHRFPCPCFMEASRPCPLQK